MKLDQEQLSDLPVDAVSQLKMIRRQFLESVSLVLLILVIFGLPLSLARIYNTGLNFNHVSHLCQSIIILIVFFFRKKLSDRWLVIMILLIFSTLSLVGFIEYGIASAGFFFAAACVFIAVITLGFWGGAACAFFYLAVTALMAYLWISGHLTFPGDAREYILLPTVWALLSVAFFITTAVLFISANGFITSLRNLVATINNQKQEIEKQAAESIRTNRELKAALSEVKTLSGMLPICAKCKKVRDDKGYWNQIEKYFQKHSGAKFSHGICPECSKELYGAELKALRKKEASH